MSSPISDSAIVAARMGPGQRTTAVPTFRQPRMRMVRLGSSRPNRVATVITAGPRVSAANTTTIMPTASGIPSDRKYGSRVKCRQNVAPAIVKPDPRITWTVPWNMS